MIERLKNNSGLIALIGMALVVMAGATLVDQEWTVGLIRHRSPRLEAIMENSIFEGQPLGANDLVMVLLLGAVAAYYVGWRWPKVGNIAAWRPQTGFALTSALVTGVYLVHGLKWITGRARPYLVLEHKAVFTQWFTFGPLFVGDGLFSGAFPSGHTAQMFLLMTAAFALAADPLVGKPVRIAGWLWGATAMALSLAMGVARCMSLNHWLTDITGAICIGAIGMHLLYFKVLRVPDQRRYAARHGHLPDLPPVWELILCLHLLIGTLGVMMVVIGARAAWLGKSPWLTVTVPIGAVLVWAAWQKSATLLRHVWQTLAAPALKH
jgi:membrane-associated phospholipid phosphatase